MTDKIPVAQTGSPDSITRGVLDENACPADSTGCSSGSVGANETTFHDVAPRRSQNMNRRVSITLDGDPTDNGVATCDLQHWLIGRQVTPIQFDQEYGIVAICLGIHTR